IDGYDPGPYHLARVLVSPDAQWNAAFEAYDTLSAGMAATWRFTSDSLLGTMDPIILPAPPTPEPTILPPAPVQQPPVSAPPSQPDSGAVPLLPIETPENTPPGTSIPDVIFVLDPPDPLTWD